MPTTINIARTVDRLLQVATAQQRNILLEFEGKEILQALGFDVPRGLLISDSSDFSKDIASIKPPYALKAVSKDIVHKSDFGAVRLGLRTTDDIADAIADIKKSVQAHGVAADLFLLEEMAESGVELVLGSLIDPEFGPMVMLGLGGIFVEIYKDVSFRICPITQADARAMIDELVGAPLLKGARGKKSVDLEKIIDALLLLGGEDGLMMLPDCPFSEIDINPFIATQERAVAVDARFVIKQR